MKMGKEAIDRFSEAMATNKIETIRVENLLGGNACIIRGNMALCKVEELSKLVGELQTARKVLFEQTGFEF